MKVSLFESLSVETIDAHILPVVEDVFVKSAVEFATSTFKANPWFGASLEQVTLPGPSMGSLASSESAEKHTTPPVKWPKVFPADVPEKLNAHVKLVCDILQRATNNGVTKRDLFMELAAFEDLAAVGGSAEGTPAHSENQAGPAQLFKCLDNKAAKLPIFLDAIAACDETARARGALRVAKLLESERECAKTHFTTVWGMAVKIFHELAKKCAAFMCLPDLDFQELLRRAAAPWTRRLCSRRSRARVSLCPGDPLNGSGRAKLPQPP